MDLATTISSFNPQNLPEHSPNSRSKPSVTAIMALVLMAYCLGLLITNRTNIQFMKVIDRFNIQIEIWERGAGYTLASGSSSTAAAAVAHKLGLCDTNIKVHMPGGQIEIQFDNNFVATMTGPVTKVCEGIIADEIYEKTF